MILCVWDDQIHLKKSLARQTDMSFAELEAASLYFTIPALLYFLLLFLFSCFIFFFVIFFFFVFFCSYFLMLFLFLIHVGFSLSLSSSSLFQSSSSSSSSFSSPSCFSFFFTNNSSLSSAVSVWYLCNLIVIHAPPCHLAWWAAVSACNWSLWWLRYSHPQTNLPQRIPH